jgi:hypothetical protein
MRCHIRGRVSRTIRPLTIDGVEFINWCLMRKTHPTFTDLFFENRNLHGSEGESSLVPTDKIMNTDLLFEWQISVNCEA